MDGEVSRLLLQASPALSTPPCGAALQELFAPWGAIGAEVAELLCSKNGFYCFHSALLVRPLSRLENPLGLEEWNAQNLWRRDYEGLDDTLFFAEDLFGGQFCIRDGAVATFEPESGVFSATCSTLNEWAARLLSEPEVLTGYPLALDWKRSGRELQPGYRLVPKVPFVCEGAYALENLYALHDVEAMRFRALIARQIRDVPDGSFIEFIPMRAPESECKDQ